MKNYMKNKIFAATAAAALCLLFLTAFSQSAAAQYGYYPFSNTSSISIVDELPASTYPSTVTVSGIPSNAAVQRVIVKLKGVTHSYPDDIGVLLVSPSGQKVRLFTDCMGDGGMGNGVSDVDLTFDDYAMTALPDNPNGQVLGGTYKPNKGTTDGFSAEHPADFPSPAPSNPYSDTLSAFNGTSGPNGTWSLYIDDDSAGGDGVIADGWELIIYAPQATAAEAVISGYVKNANNQAVSFARLTMYDTHDTETHVYTNMYGYYEFPAQEVGYTYIIGITSKFYDFDPSVQGVNLLDNTTLNWTAEP